MLPPSPDPALGLPVLPAWLREDKSLVKLWVVGRELEQFLVHLDYDCTCPGPLSLSEFLTSGPEQITAPCWPLVLQI